MKFNQAPLFLLMNPKPAQGSKELPVLIHESEAHTLDGQSKMIFVQLAFQASGALFRSLVSLVSLSFSRCG